MTSNTSRAPKSSSTAAAEPTEPTLDTVDEASAPSAPAETEPLTVEDVNVEPAVDTLATTPAPTPAETAETAEAVDPRKVKIRLANPLDKVEDLRRLGLEPKEGGYKPLDEIVVSREHARSLITAGYAHKIDPEDLAAVEAALTPVRADA